MAELGHKVSGQPRESFGLCVSLTFLGKATQTAVEIPPSAARTSILSLDGDMKEALCLESGEQREQSHETRSTAFRVRSSKQNEKC